MRRLSTFSKHKPILVLAFVLLFVFGIFFSSHTVHADSVIADATTAVGNGLIAGLQWLFFGLAKLLIGLAVFGLRFFMELARYNGYIDAPPVVLGWYMVRDIANMFFVVALLIIAFGTILGLEQYEWRKLLVKLIFGAIFINFSRLIIGLLIDASQVFTVTFLDAVEGTAGGNLIQMLKLEKILAINHAQDLTLNNVTDSLRLDILVGSIVAFLFALLAFLSIFAYAMLMVMRVVVLWILIIFSPLAFVLQAIPQTKAYAEEFWQEVMKYIIVAPMMTFFLWLAFATLGNGDINNHVGISTASAEQAQAAANATFPVQSSASLSEASTWENMSAFIIAIAFLFAGLERVLKVGTIGGSFVSGAMQFGKEALEVASGYRLARLGHGKARGLVGKAVGGVGAGIKLAGGAAIRRTVGAPAKEIAAGIASRVGAGVAMSKEKRAQRAKELEKGGTMDKFWARVIEPAERAEKRAEDWKKGAEFAKTRFKENLGTSSTAAGEFKQRQGRRAFWMEAVSSAKRGAKEEKLDGQSVELYLDVRKKAAKRFGLDLDTDAGQKDFEENKSTYLKQLVDANEIKLKPDETLEDKQNLLELGGTLNKDKKLIADSKIEVAQRTGKKEDEAFKLLRKVEVEAAQARDKYLVSQNREGEAVYEQNVRAKHRKEDTEKQSVGDINLVSARAQRQLELIRQAKPGSKAEEELKRQLSYMTLAFYDRAAAFGSVGRDTILKGLGSSLESSVDLKQDAVAGLQARVLSAELGTQVDRAKVQDAFEELQKRHGGKGSAESNAFLEGLLSILNKSAGEGAIGNAGLIIRDVNKSTGEVSFRLANIDDQQVGAAVAKENLDHIKGRRGNALASSKATSVSGFSDSVDSNAEGDAILASAEAVQNAANIFKSLTANNLEKVDQTFTIGDLSSILENSNDSRVKEFLDALQQKNNDARAIEYILKAAKEKFTTAPAANRTLVDNVLADLARRTGKGGRGGGPAAPAGGGPATPPPPPPAPPAAPVSPPGPAGSPPGGGVLGGAPAGGGGGVI